MPHTLTRHDFDPATHNEHFLIFLEANEHEVGDELESYEYTLWISEQVIALKEKHGLKPYDSLGHIPDWKSTFTNHLRSSLKEKRN